MRTKGGGGICTFRAVQAPVSFALRGQDIYLGSAWLVLIMLLVQ